MRCAPLALIKEEESILNNYIRQNNNITHELEDAYLADLCFIKTLHLIFEGKSKEQIYNTMISWTEENFKIFHKYFMHIYSIKWDKVSTSGTIYDTLFSAFWGLLRCNNFEEALILIVNRGDDSDTCGAVTGALCGAYYGMDAIPERWLNKIKRKDEIESELKRILKT